MEKNLGVFIILILTILVLGASFFLLKNRNSEESILDNNLENNDASEIENQETPTPNQEPSISETEEQVSTDTGGGGGSGIIDTIQDILGLGCSEEQIVYSMTNFNKTSACNENQSDICIDKTISCSMEIKNRDSEISGVFEVELLFVEARNQDNIIKTSTSRFFLQPKDSQVFSDSSNIQSTGIDGIANKEINCFFNTVEIPKKEVCV